MRKFVIAVVVVIGSLTYLAYFNWRNTQSYQANLDHYIPLYSEHREKLALTMDMKTAEVRTVIWMDSIFSRNREYAQLKEDQYQLYMKNGSFNARLSNDIIKKVILSVGGNPLNKEDNGLATMIFRKAVIFKILDELKSERMPRKEDIELF